jgi:hypothetical protein
MINIYTLKGCSQCKWLVSELDKIGLKYRNLDADENDKLATRLEDLLNTTLYPIVHIDKSSTDIYFISEELNHQFYDNTISILHYGDIPHLIHLIKTYT